MADTATETVKAKKHRSPAYPFLGLETAIERARQVYEKERTHPAALPVMAGHWGFKAKSSGGLQTAAALKQYGLLEESAGSGAERRLKLSELARQILLQQKNSAGWIEATKRAAVSPPLYGELFSKWGTQLPSDENFKTHLVLDRNFNDAVVDSVIKNYKDTLVFSRLSESGTMSDDESGAVGQAPGESFGSTAMDTTVTGASSAPPPPPKPGVRLFSWPLAKGVTAEVRLSGGDVKAVHLEMLRQYLELAKTAIENDSD